MFILMCKGVWSIGNLQSTQPKWSLYCYSHNPALFETFIQAADRCCWQEHLVGLPVHKLIGAEREKSSAARTHSPSKVLKWWNRKEDILLSKTST